MTINEHRQAINGLGIRQREALGFFTRLNGDWHSFANDKAKVIASLEAKGLLEVKGDQARAVIPV